VHGEIGKVRGSKYARTAAPAFEFIKQAAPHTATSVGWADVDQRNKAAVEETVVHDAIAHKNSVVERDKTLALTNRVLDGDSSRQLNLERRVHSHNLLDVSVGRRPNNNRRHRVFGPARLSDDLGLMIPKPADSRVIGEKSHSRSPVAADLSEIAC
jgi:hypothetical protein